MVNIVLDILFVVIFENKGGFSMKKTRRSVRRRRKQQRVLLLAGIAVGYWKDLEDVRRNWALSNTFHPAMPEEKREKLLSGWKRAVKCALAWAEE